MGTRNQMAVELPILSRFAFDLWAFFKWKSNGIRTPALVGLIGGPPRRDRGSSHARCVPFAYPKDSFGEPAAYRRRTKGRLGTRPSTPPHYSS